MVGRETESWVNEATRPADRVRHDSMGILALIVTTLLTAGIMTQLWKRDVASAFRRIPIRSDHLDLAWVAWWADNGIWVAQHLGMPFGTVSAVYAWHRMGHALLLIVMVLFKVPMGRYVDDYFGANREGVTCTGGHCLSVIAALIGLPTDDNKDASDVISVALLEATVIVHQPNCTVLVKVEKEKAEKWVNILLAWLASGVCSPQDAAAMPGRLSFSVTLAANRVGRAFIKPFYDQQFAPMHGSMISKRLYMAMRWFIEYLITRPPAEVTGIKLRPRVVSWHAAAGSSRWVAAVLRVKDVFLWTRMRTPQHLWQQLAPRDDEQIGFQELLGLVLLLGTFRSEIQGSSWVSFGNNDGITHALEKRRRAQ